MPFGRLHEEAAGDSKLLALSDAAWRMWGMGLIYCQKNLTDGYIPAGAIFLWGVRAKRLHLVADELCAPQVPGKEALWAKADGGYQVHDYLQWNDSKDEILKMRADARDRIARYRDRHRRDGEQTTLQSTERNALPNALENAHDVVRGTWKEGKRSSGVMAGSLPRDHVNHVACDATYSRCVPYAVHDKLKNLLAPKHGGDRSVAGLALTAWYPTVWETLPDDFVMPDAFKFWQARFDAAFASKDNAKPEQKSTVPGADRTDAYLRKQREV